MDKRFEALDAFRGIAALIVAVAHLNVVGVISDLTIVKNAFFFVDFFFVLSGFVIAYSYGDKVASYKQFKDFSVKRFARIWPLHCFMLFLFIPFAMANVFLGIELGDRFSIYSFISNFFLVQSFVMIPLSWNITAWSISTEFYTYLIFGFLCLFPFFQRKAYVSVAIIMISFAFMMMKLDINNTLFQCLASFFLGNLAARCYSNFKIKPWMEWAIIIAIVFILSNYQGYELYFIMPFFFFATVIIFSQESGVLSKLLRAKLFQVLGVLSYSIYLTHTWLISAIKALSIVLGKLVDYTFMQSIDGVRFINFGFSNNDFIFVPFLLIVVGFSFLTYKFIEIKCQKAILNSYFLPEQKEKSSVLA